MARLSFLDLPGEIRNQIYRHLLVIPSLTTLRVLGSDQPLSPQILGSCRKIYLETLQILYGCNTFVAHHSLLSDFPRLRPYYPTISSTAMSSLIRKYHIRVRLDCDPNFSALQATNAFTGVEELTIEVFQAQFASSDFEVLRLFEGIRCVKKVKIYGSITSFPEYVRWLQAAMKSTLDCIIPDFVLGESIADGRPYDLWTVSENMA